MANDGTKILIVDDTPADLQAIAGATRLCLTILAVRFTIQEARSMAEALTMIQDFGPEDIVITDLFMPERELAPLPVIGMRNSTELQLMCGEMEWPHGMRLLVKLRDMKLRPKTLATTSFWTYPGFLRYADELYESLQVNGALPKDVYYIVSNLDAGDTVKSGQIFHFPPLRILIQTYDELLNWRVSYPDMKTEDLRSRMRRLHLRSLFDEAAGWLHSYPQYADDVRRQVSAQSKANMSNDMAVSETQKKKGRKIYASQSGMRTADREAALLRYISPSKWMPTFSFNFRQSERGTRISGGSGSYKRLLSALDDDNWWVDMHAPSLFAINDGTGKVLKWIKIDKVLYPPRRGGKNRPDDRDLARLLLTLGFFTCWWHGADKPIFVLTGDEIDFIIRDALGHSYREDARNIEDDVIVLDRYLTATIATGHREWERHLENLRNIPLIERTRIGGGNQVRHWLNGSIRVIERNANRILWPYSIAEIDQ
jgi:CheY-like chemotaxis protein